MKDTKDYDRQLHGCFILACQRLSTPVGVDPYNFSNGSYLKMPFSIGLITQILQQDDSDQKFIS